MPKLETNQAKNLEGFHRNDAWHHQVFTDCLITSIKSIEYEDMKNYFS
ncbi:hypothetical protein [Legionella sainthelensi]|nr:hypothetical protein [Legionella sainthelensi]